MDENISYCAFRLDGECEYPGTCKHQWISSRGNQCHREKTEDLGWFEYDACTHPATEDRSQENE